MQRAVDVLGAPVLEAKRVCQCQLISLQAPATGLPFTGAGCSLPHSAWPLPLPDSLEPAGGDASWSPPGHSICRNVPHPAGTSFLAAHVSQLKAMSCEGVAVTLFMGTLCYIKNEMVCNLTHNSEILPCSSWNLRHCCFTVPGKPGCIPIQASEQELVAKMGDISISTATCWQLQRKL